MLSNSAFRLLTAPTALSKLLGPLEIEIMQIMWQGGKRTVKAVHRILATQHARAYTTIMTTMSRLAEKGVLQRERVGLAYVYTAAISEQAFVSQALTNILDAIAHDYPATLVDELQRRREHVAVGVRPA